MLEAPTGFGKTPVVIYALIPLLRRGAKVVWAVRTGSETDRPIEEFRVFRERAGVEFLAMSFRGKRDMCLLAREFSEPLDYSEVSYICSRRKSRCPYYRRLKRGVDVWRLLERGALTYGEVFEAAAQMRVCPYFLQREILRRVDVVSLSYNYVVNPSLSWSLRALVPFHYSILVVDEAHNLQSINLGGDVITEGTLRRARAEALELGSGEAAAFVKQVEERVLDMFGGLEEDDAEPFEPEELLPPSLELLESVLRAGQAVREARLREGRRPRSSLYHFARFFERALALSGVRGVALIAERVGGRLHLSIWDMRAAELFSDVWSSFKRVILMSGTLSPLDAFAETIGLARYHAITVPSPYGRENASVYLVRDLTTRGEELREDMAAKYVEAISRLLGRVGRNAAVFTASYRVQEGLLRAGLRNAAEALGYEVFLERRGMSGHEAAEMLRRFKSLAREGRGLLVGPMGGRFAEGADYPGEELMCVFLAGIPFEKPTAKTRLYVDYYRELYGEEKGRLYAYVYPALRRASQALGRALRSPHDRAVIVLGDYRYRGYISLLPDYVQKLATPILHKELDKVALPWRAS